MQIRKAAINSLTDVLIKQRKASKCVERYSRGLLARDSALLHELVYGVLRNYFALEADYSRFCRTKPDDVARMGLCVGSYQIRMMRVPTHAAVAETVEAVKQLEAKAAGFVNAVLRRVAEHEPPKKLKPYQRAELPQWLYRQWRDAFGAEALVAVSAALKTVPPLCLALFVNRDHWLMQAREQGFEAEIGHLSPHAVLLPAGTDVTTLPGYEWGDLIVMDQAAQAAVMAIELKDPCGLIVDLCSAPGGKCSLLSHRFPAATIIAVERYERRLPRLQENLARLECRNVKLLQADGTNLPLADRSVDAVLLDAPCSASGILRRHPDAKFLHAEADLAALTELQAQLLHDAERILKDDGRLVYAVCSILEQENEQVINSCAGEWQQQRTLPSLQCDGFFHAWKGGGQATPTDG